MKPFNLCPYVCLCPNHLELLHLYRLLPKLVTNGCLTSWAGGEFWLSMGKVKIILLACSIRWKISAEKLNFRKLPYLLIPLTKKYYSDTYPNCLNISIRMRMVIG